MKSIIITVISAIVLSTTAALGQNAHFTNSGTIEFEKTVNMFALIKKEINKDNESFLEPAFETYKKNQPQFKKLKSTLTFGDGKTKFVPGEPEESRGFFGDNAMVSQNNTVFTDLDSHTFINQKVVFEETFLVKDSTRKINWKITDETREIAGYTCRRANAIIMDSIYVVAFYTDKIHVSGGPEGFTGLPGMILGVALPHENITWFATKVQVVDIPTATIHAETKGKKIDRKSFLDALYKVMKNWDTWGRKMLLVTQI